MKAQEKRLAKVLSDPVEFISRLKIKGKSGSLIKLSPNKEQIKIIEALVTEEDTLVLKGRQIGSSTIVSAYLFWKAYTATEPITIAILSHKLASARHLLEIHKTFYNNLPNFLKKPLGAENSTILSFLDSGANIIAVSAEGKGGLRSFTCSYLHMSEYAFAPAPDELKATALSALNDGQLIIESTAKHFDDALHKEWMRAERGEARWKALFFPWFEHESYREDYDEVKLLPLTEAEVSLQQLYNLDLAQIAWRRSKISKMGNIQKFNREYPATIEDAYSISGSVYLSREDMVDVECVQIDPMEVTVFADPDPDDSYAIGVDVSAGVGRDYSVFYIISKKTYAPVYMLRTNEMSPAYLAERIMGAAIEYNRALVLIESNNFGNVVLNEIRHLGYFNIYKEDGKDWITTSKSKTIMFENLKDKIIGGYIRWLDNIVYSELRSITISERGAIELQQLGDSHSDNAVALALSYMALEKVELKNVLFLPEWIKTQRAHKIKTSAGIGAGANRRY